MMRQARRWLGGGHWPRSALVDPASHRSMFDQAFWLVRAYYAAMLFIAYQEMVPLWRTAVNGGKIEPIWPVFWMTDVQNASLFLLISLIATATIAVLLPDRRWPKILVFISFALTAAFRTSFALGSINHGNHFWLWLALCFCFLPPGSREDLRLSLSKRYRFLITFWFAQALILLFYSMSGFWKLAASIEALALGEMSVLHPEALAQFAAWKMIQTQQDTLLGPILMSEPWLGWPAYLWVIYVELFAILVLFRPALHRLWGGMLIAFHIGTFFLLNIAFPKHVLVLTLLFVWSPFLQGSPHLRMIVSTLPGLGWLLGRAAEPASPDLADGRLTSSSLGQKKLEY